MRERISDTASHRPLLVVLIVALILAIVGGVLFSVHRFNQSEEIRLNSSPDTKEMDFELDPGVSYAHAVVGEKLFFYSSENIKIANRDGHKEQDFSLPVSQPFLTSRGDFALIADKDAKRAYLFHNGKQKTEINLSEPIIAENVNTRGDSVFVTKGESHQNTVSVFDAGGNEKFRWNSGGMYVLAADISDNGRDVAVSAMRTDTGVITTHFLMFSVDKTEAFANDIYADELFSAVHFKGNSIYCIGESKTYIYNGGGKLTGTIDYAERELLSYNTDGNALLLVFSGSGLSIGACDMETYNAKGERLAQFHSQHEIAFLSAYGNRILAKNGRVLSVFDIGLTEQFRLSPDMDLLDFMFYGNESRGVGISAAGARIISVNAE